MQQKRSNADNLLLELARRTNKAIFIYNTGTHQFTYANAAFETLVNKANEIFESNPEQIWDSIHAEDKEYVEKGYKKLLKNKVKNVNLEFRISLRADQLKWIAVSAHCLEQGENNQLVAGFVEDISAVKQHLSNAKKFAAKKDSVLEILAHDLAGPLSNISTVAGLLAEHGREYNDPQFDKMINIIANTSDRSIRLIREFVKQEFLESSNTHLIKKRVNLVEILSDIIEQYKSSEQDINKIFSLNSSSEKIYIEIDDYKFSQVINNLISNSIKFTHDGGKINIDVDEGDDVVLLKLSDNGIGIPNIEQEELFEKFTKARRDGLKGEPSVGLGMSIIKTIVEWHQGQIWFESEVNKGTTFYIELPKGM